MVPDLSPEDYSPAGDGICPRPVPSLGGCGLDSMKFVWKHMEVSIVMEAPLSIWFIMEHPIKKWMI